MKMIPDTAKLRTFFSFALISASLSSFAYAESLRQASVSEAVNSVSYQANESAPQKPATPGTIIHTNNVVRTGVQSRAELQFSDKTVTRLGANSVFTFDAQGQKLNLEEGSMLFSKPKETSAFQISTPAATCAISGTTGFMQAHNHSFLFGLLEGHSRIVVNGVTYSVAGGNLLVVKADGSVHLLNFDIVSFLKHAGLYTKFKSTLPNQKEIDTALAKFLSLEDRGFIKPPPANPFYGFPDLDNLNNLDFAAQLQLFEQLKTQMPLQQPSDNCCYPPCGYWGSGGYGGSGSGSGSGFFTPNNLRLGGKGGGA